MDIKIEELLNARIGEPLEEKLKQDVNFWEKQENWRNAIHEFDDMVSMTKEQWLAFQRVEDAFLDYNISYGEAAYKMGYYDGVEIGMEQTPDGRKSVLTVEDMANLVSVYGAVRRLKEVLLGGMDEYWEGDGAFSAFENVFQIIENAACLKIKFVAGEDATAVVTEVLSDENMKPEEKARKLLGVE